MMMFLAWEDVDLTLMVCKRNIESSQMFALLWNIHDQLLH